MATNIVDPNDGIASQSLVNLGLNATPDYSDMFIFAELTSQRRGSSILTTGGVGKITTLTQELDAVNINLMGFDQDTGKYTTKWTNNYDGTEKADEGFGMTSIKVTTNSSYVPQVDIEFVDIRGQSLFSKERSPYSVLWNMPPAVFTLTLKGVYGKAISYNLHKVRDQNRFDASTGNWYVNVQFVAQRYAPLTDVLFKYIDIVPLMESGVPPSGIDNSAVNFNYNLPPKNTRELITRAKKLYDDVEAFKVDSKEASELNTIKSSFTSTQLLISLVANYKTFINSDLQTNFGMFTMNSMGTYSNEAGANMSSNDSMAMKPVKRLAEFDEAIKGFSPSEMNIANFNQRLCVLYEYNETANGAENNLDATRRKQVITNSENLMANLLREGKKVNSKIPDSSIKLLTEKDLQPNKGKKYIGLDITDYYILVRQDLVKKQQEYATKNTAFKNQINDISKKTIGFVPTIRNIFSVLTHDVETFFRLLRQTCKDAETEHAKHFDQIVGNNRTKAKFISAFPEIIKYVSISDSSTGGGTINREQRAYPGEPGLGFSETYFPEVDFVENFISTFLNVIKNDQILNLKESVDADGNNKWIPIGPLDSVVNGRINADSPYKGIYSIISPKGTPSILDQLLNRYYIASQYSYCYLFYEPDAVILKDIAKFFGVNIENKNDKLVEYVAKAEATNLVNSIVDATLLTQLQTQMTSWSQNLDGFYDTLNSSVTHYSDLTDQLDSDDRAYMIINGQTVSKNRQSDDYRGFEMLFNSPTLRNKSDAGTADEADGQVNIVDEFLNEVGNDGFLKTLIFDSHGFDDFTKQNIPYIKDDSNNEEDDESDFTIMFKEDETNSSITSRVSSLLAQKANTIKAILEDTNLSNEIRVYYVVNALFGAISYYDEAVNKKFAFPSVIEVPLFAHQFMGALTYFYKFSTPTKEAELEYFSKTYLKISDPTNQAYVQYLSNNDADLLLSDFGDYVADTTENGFTSLKLNILNLIAEVQAIPDLDSSDTKEEYEKRLENSSDLDPNAGQNDYSLVMIKTIKRLFLLNYTEITFLPTTVPDNGLLPINTFLPLAEINRRGSRNAQINSNYFGQFFKEVIKLCEEKKQELTEIESKFRESISDNDIKTQTYYSFKNVSDKWVIGFDDAFAYGASTPLINEFAFVDRFFNDIGDKVVIDFRPLIDMSQDYDVSVFTVMARILALNNFEFFPIQNFMNFQQEEWLNSFKTYGSSRELTKSQTPAFICMYIGGSSSNLNDPLSGLENDGFIDEAALLKSPDYNVNNVKGFKVHFAKQNQSMFTGIEINTNEHKDSNESLAILSEIAQDQSVSSPVPKGQNLFSVYAQRSYTCRIQMLGNMMIQPTQYFILENVPMFNGAYLITDVEHTIVPNSLKTSFSGVRIRTNPNPLVTDFATSAGVRSGDDNAITNGVVNQANVSLTDGTNRNNPNSTGKANFNQGGAFPLNPAITQDMTGRLISPQE